MKHSGWAILVALSCTAPHAVAQDARHAEQAARSNATQTSTKTQHAAEDANFAMTAGSINRGEVKLGKLAQDKGSCDPVKDYGKLLVSDHSLAQDELEQLASQVNLPKPDQILQQQQNLYDRLSQLSGDNFDRQFADAMVKAHQDAIQKFEREANHGESHALRTYAKMQLPILRAHEQIAKLVQDQVAKMQKKKSGD